MAKVNWLTGKTVVVTGASSGMGREFVHAIYKTFDLDEIWVIARREHLLAELKDLYSNSLSLILFSFCFF